MKVLAGVIIVAVVAWLQISLFGHLRPLGVMPNLVLVVVVLFGLWTNATPTLAAAIGGGLLLDLSSGSDFGLRMAFFVVVALALVAGRQLGLQADATVTALAAVALGTILYNLVVIATLGGAPADIAISRVGRELVDNVVVTLLMCIIRLNIGRPSHTALELDGKVRP